MHLGGNDAKPAALEQLEAGTLCLRNSLAVLMNLYTHTHTHTHGRTDKARTRTRTRTFASQAQARHHGVIHGRVRVFSHNNHCSHVCVCVRMHLCAHAFVCVCDGCMHLCVRVMGACAGVDAQIIARAAALPPSPPRQSPRAHPAANRTRACSHTPAAAARAFATTAIEAQPHTHTHRQTHTHTHRQTQCYMHTARQKERACERSGVGAYAVSGFCFSSSTSIVPTNRPTNRPTNQPNPSYSLPLSTSLPLRLSTPLYTAMG